MFRTIFGSFIETAVGKKTHLLSLFSPHHPSICEQKSESGGGAGRLASLCSCASSLVSAGPSIMTPFGR